MGHATALGVGTAHGMARRLGRNHPDVQVGAGRDEAVMHIETMGKHQGCALLDVGLHVMGVHGTDLLIGQQNHDHIGGLDGIGDFRHFQTGFLNLGPGCAAFAQTNDHFDAAVVQVLRVRMALAAVSDDGHGLAFDQAQVAIFVVKHFHLFLRNKNGGKRLVTEPITLAKYVRHGQCRWSRCEPFPKSQRARSLPKTRRSWTGHPSIQWCSSCQSRR